MSKLNANATEWRPGGSGDGSGPEFTLPASTNEMEPTTTNSGSSNNHVYTSQSVSRTGTAANTPALTAMNNNVTHTPQLPMNNNNNNNNSNATNMNCSDNSTANESAAAAAAMMTMMMNQNNQNSNNNFNFANPMNLNSSNMPNMMMPMGMMPQANVAMMPSMMPNMMMMQPSPLSQEPSTFATPAMFMPQPFAMPMNTPMMGLTNVVNNNNNASAAAASVMGGGNFVMPQPQGMAAMPMMPPMMMNVNPTVMPEYYPTFMTINKSIKVDSENSSDANVESSKEGTKKTKPNKDQTTTDATTKTKDSSNNNNVTFGEMNWKVEFDKVIKLTEELIEQQISGVAEEAAQKKVAQEIFNTPALTILNESSNNNTANESKNKGELGVLSQIAPNSISAAMSANNNNNNNGINSTSHDNTINNNNNNNVVVTNTSINKSAQHTPLLSAEQGGQEQKQEQQQQDQLSLQAKQTPNTTFSPEQPQSSTTVLTPSQHEKIEKWQARNDATTTTEGNSFQNTHLTPSAVASSSNINNSTITNNQYSEFEKNNGNNNKSVGEYNDEDDEDEDNDDVMTSFTANNNNLNSNMNNNNLYSSASTINGGNNNKLLPPLTIHGNRRWKKLTKAQQRREQAQKNAFEAFASALLHSVSPFMAPLRVKCKTSLPHIKLDQRFGKIGQPQTAIAQFIVAPLVTNYRPRHFHDVTPGDLMEYHYDMALVMTQLTSAYGVVIGYGSTWKRYAVPYCYVLCSEYRQEVLRLCPHEIPNSRQEAIYTDDILKDITDVILAVEELEPLQHMSLLQAMRKRVNLAPMYDAFDAIFKPIENYRIEIYDLHKTPTRFLLKTSKPEIELKPHPIVLYGDDKLWEELPLVAHVNPNDDVAHLPSRITHLHIGYTKPSDSTRPSNTTITTAEEGHQASTQGEKTKQPVSTTKVAGNNVATLLAHAEAKQANRSSASKENITSSNKSINAHTAITSSSSSMVKSTGTNVDIKGKVANLAEHLIGKHHTVLQEKAQSVKANNNLGTNSTDSIKTHAIDLSSNSKVNALVTKSKNTIREVVRNAKNVVISVNHKLWPSTSNSSSSSSSSSAALPLPSSTVILPFAISVLCVSLTAGALLWKRRENR